MSSFYIDNLDIDNLDYDKTPPTSILTATMSNHTLDVSYPTWRYPFYCTDKTSRPLWSLCAVQPCSSSFLILTTLRSCSSRSSKMVSNLFIFYRSLYWSFQSLRRNFLRQASQPNPLNLINPRTPYLKFPSNVTKSLPRMKMVQVLWEVESEFLNPINLPKIIHEAEEELQFSNLIILQCSCDQSVLRL